MPGAMRVVALASLALVACGGGGTTPPDGSVVTTAACAYEPLIPTAHAGGTVAAAPLSAGAAERVLDVPVGTALGGYTGRAGFISSAGTVDTRKIKLAGTFNPSIGVTSAPKVKALALTAGDETVVIVKIDMIFVYEGMLFDLEQRLGPAYAGKVMLTATHSHSAFAQFTGHGPLKLGAGQLRDVVYQRFLDTAEATARDALAARRPAKLGVAADTSFDPTDQVSHDRRSENNDLPGGKRKDDHLYVIRVDGTDGAPIAIVPVYGVHGTLNGEDNPLASTDAPGAMERVLEEEFDHKVVVMHLQSAGADTSPAGHGGIDCNHKPGNAGDPCFGWTAEEGHGRAALPLIKAAWTTAGAAMRGSIELEMLTRSVETGPKPETFTIRGGAVAYAPFDLSRNPDGKILDASGNLISPIDEFNAPVGAALCQDPEPMFPAAQIPGTDGLPPYGSCLRLDVAGGILGQIFDVDFGVSETSPVCETTRTTISALRLGDYLVGTMPGEVSVLLADLLRSKSPVAPDHTIVVGYAQGHVGYLLRPEDWIRGGYEPSVTFWGPLEAEYLAERLEDLWPLALTPAREDGTTAGTTKVKTAKMTDNLVIDDPAPMAGTIPTALPTATWSRTGHPTQAQPVAHIPRVAGIATFTWIGDDPLVQTPRVRLDYEAPPNSGTFAPVTRRSGRQLTDAELVLAYTPEPLQRSTGPQTHVWNVEWQAVPWLGSAHDELVARASVPLGRYRFHVEGKGWTLDSAPFTVDAGGLIAATARTAMEVTVTVSLSAPRGWRLLDPALPSNLPVPLGGAAVTVEQLDASGAPLVGQSALTTTAGTVTISAAVGVTQVRVTDAYGNVVVVPVA
jgi:neutral ceramidase